MNNLSFISIMQDLFLLITIVIAMKAIFIGSDFNIHLWFKHGDKYLKWYYNRPKFPNTSYKYIESTTTDMETDISNIKLFYLDTEIDDEAGVVITAFNNGRFCGIVKMDCNNKSSATLMQLFVHQDFRRKGIGRCLVNECFRIASERGCKTIGLLIKEGNPMESFYSSFGFFAAYKYFNGDCLMIHKF